MKHTIYSILCIGIYIAIGIVAANSTMGFGIQQENSIIEEPTVKHDWECNHIIHDFYHGYISKHYVDSYEEMITGGIRFISHDGTVYEIPYPYFVVEDNK